MTNRLAFLMLIGVVSATIPAAFTAGRDGDTMEVMRGQARRLAVRPTTPSVPTSGRGASWEGRRIVEGLCYHIFLNARTHRTIEFFILLILTVQVRGLRVMYFRSSAVGHHLEGVMGVRERL